MSDPLEQLARFDGGDPAAPPLPAAEVRRRGDRLRRRHQVLAGVGAAVAVAVIVVPLAVLGARDDGSRPQPAPAPTPAPTPTSTATPTPRPTPTVPSETPSETPAPTVSAPTSSGAIPAGFPLAAGWPSDAEPGADHGLAGPSRSLAAFTYRACGADLPTPAVLDHLRASWSNPEDYRTRQLYLLDDADGAVAYVTAVRDFYAACPEEDTGDGLGQVAVTGVRATRVGGQSYAVVRSFELSGNPTIGLEVLHVVRLGRAVLIDTASNEGSGEESRVRSQIDQQTAAGAPVVAAMCAFTDAGC